MVMLAQQPRLQAEGAAAMTITDLPRNAAFTDRDERQDNEAAYIGGQSERDDRLSSRDDD